VASTVRELDAAFKTAASVNMAKAVLISADPFFHRQRAKIVGLAKKYKIAACYPWREYVDAGGLVSHGPNLANAYRRLGIWAAMVMDGAKLEDLPNADSGERELVVNLKTAKALGLNLPPLLVQRADEVIE
jgi:putative ABC transport system substrate-binding protein